jgi:hypothetical protein
MSEEFCIHLDKNNSIHDEEIYRQVQYILSISDNLETCVVDYSNMVITVLSSILAAHEITNHKQVIDNLDRQLIPLIREKVEDYRND